MRKLQFGDRWPNQLPGACRDQGRTGYPWIDAIMIQLNKVGWMHHLARHSVVRMLPCHAAASPCHAWRMLLRAGDVSMHRVVP